jgi:hypothetical protein
MREPRKVKVLRAKERLHQVRTLIRWTLDGPEVISIYPWGKNYMVVLAAEGGEPGRSFVADRDDICWEVSR